jgi:hypothetical protein
MELRQDVVNALATKYGLISNPIETGSDGTQRICLERDEADDRYCQVLLVVRNGKVVCHTGLYRERAIINDGEVSVDSVELAVEHAISRFNSFTATVSDQSKERARA